MNPVVLALFGWLVPGGAYLLVRRYLQFAVFAILVSATFAIGLVLNGGYRWPEPAELQGIDGFTALLFKAGAFARMLAGGPYLLAHLFHGSGAFLDGRFHEYGTTLLTLAGLFNLLALSNTFELRKTEPR